MLPDAPERSSDFYAAATDSAISYSTYKTTMRIIVKHRSRCFFLVHLAAYGSNVLTIETTSLVLRQAL
jgi:hypothetical protein